jgi:hypothetical protein
MSKVLEIIVMELRDFIEAGSKKADGLTALGLILGLSQPRMSDTKAHRKPLPLDAAVKLSDYLGVELKAVLAANELVTEKKEEKRRYWSNFIDVARAATVTLTFGCVISFMSPTPAQAAPVLEKPSGTLCIM